MDDLGVTSMDGHPHVIFYPAQVEYSSIGKGQRSAESGGTANMTGWCFGTFFIFPYIGLLIIPIDVHIFQRGGPTTNQMTISKKDEHSQVPFHVFFFVSGLVTRAADGTRN